MDVMAIVASPIEYLDLVKDAVGLYDADIVRVIIDKSPLPAETARAARDAMLRLISSGATSTPKLQALIEMGEVVRPRTTFWPTATVATSMLLTAAITAWGFDYLELLLLAVRATGVQLLPKVSRAYAAAALVPVTTGKLEDSIYSMHGLFSLLGRYGWLDDDMVALVDILRPCVGQETDII